MLPLDGKRNLAFQNDGQGRLTFVWRNGNPVFDNRQTECVMSLLVEAPWWGDPLGKRRSQLATVQEDDATTKSRLEEYARAALQPALADGRLRSVSPTATRSELGKWSLRVVYTTPAGEPGSLDVPLSV